MRIANWLAGGAAAAALMAAGQADAVVYTATYQGTVTSGYDTTGIYGAAGANLAGLNFSVVLGVDTSLGVTTTDFWTSGTLGTRPSSIFTSTAVTIGGVTHSLDSLAGPAWPGHTGEFRENFEDYFAVTDPGGPECQAPINACGSELGHTYDVTAGHNLFDGNGVYFGTTQQSVQLFLLTETNLPTPNQPITGAPLSVAPGDITLFSGSFRTYDFTLLQSGNGPQTVTYAYDTSATFQLNSLTISGGVPEPQSWALMILGFGMLGAVLRRRRRPDPAHA